MVCSKLFSGDLPELTSKIIQYFQNDFLTLHSCILVNRLWCRLSIPLLWEDPFSKILPKNYHFINIYLDKLNEDDKIKLKEYGIIFPSSTLFNYSSFIKCFSTQNVSTSIFDYARVLDFYTDMRLLNFIFLSLIKIFIENEANLHTFDVIYTLGFINESFNSVFEIILKNPKFICNVKNLKIGCSGLISNFSIFSKCFYLNCNSISSLYIHSYYTEKNDLSKIINSQKNLQKIAFSYSNDPLKCLKNSNCLNTLKIIIFYKLHLNSIKFNEVFDQLNVLESIHILYCYPLNSTIIQQIINLTKPFKLRSLFIFKGSTLNIDSLKLLLQKYGNYLENIGLKSLIDNELKLQLFKLFKIYCVNIKFLEIFRFDHNIFSAFDLIKNVQQNLNYLSINFSQFSYVQRGYDVNLSSILLQNLGQILPYRLEYLNLALKFNINDLEMFFNNSQNIFIKKLLIKNKLYSDGEDILPCIKKYVMKEKRASYLAMETVPIANKERECLSNLKDEVEEFKLYDIQVMVYENLYIEFHDFMDELY